MKIKATIHIDEDLIKGLVFEQFSLEVKSLSLLGEGWDNKVYLVNNDYVFRFPRREVATNLLAKEARILPHLAGRFQLMIPKPLFIGQSSKRFKWPFYGHQFIPGQTGRLINLSLKQYENAAVKLAIFLKKLHSLPYEEFLSFEDMIPDFYRASFALLNENLTTKLKELDKSLDISKYLAKIQSIGREAQSYVANKTDLSLVHGDLYHLHLMFDEHNELSGIIDWGDIGLSDRVADLGVLYQFFPKVVHEAFWAHYGEVSDQRKKHAEYLGLYYALILLWYGSDRNDQDLIKASFQTLDRLAI